MDHSIDDHTASIKTLPVNIKKHDFITPSSSPWHQCRLANRAERKLKQTRNLSYESVGFNPLAVGNEKIGEREWGLKWRHGRNLIWKLCYCLSYIVCDVWVLTYIHVLQY